MKGLDLILFVIISWIGRLGALKVWNDGPSTIGSPITFYVEYEAGFDDTYLYEFKDRNNDTMHRIVFGRDKVDAEFTYDKMPDEKEHIMNVEVYVQFRGTKLWRMDHGSSQFQLSNFLVGKILLNQAATPTSAIEKGIVSSKNLLNLTFDLHDPTNFFKDFTKSYSWKINGDPVDKADTNILGHIFDKPASYNVSVFATVSKGGMDRHVEIVEKIVVKDAIKKLQYAGKFFLFRNQSLDLNVSCDQGSPKFYFCKEISNKPNRNGHQDECHEVHNNITDISNVCNFHITWYFQTAGKYNLSVRVWNDVSDLFERIEVSVLEITRQPSLTFIVIPVVSGILSIVVIVFAVAFHIQNRRRFAVEVADFDFQAHDESVLLEKTFWVRLRESMDETLQGTCFRRHQPDFQEDPYVNPYADDDDLGIEDDGYASNSLHT